MIIVASSFDTVSNNFQVLGVSLGGWWVAVAAVLVAAVLVVSVRARAAETAAIVLVLVTVITVVAMPATRATAVGDVHGALWEVTDDEQPTYGLRPPLAVCRERLSDNLGQLQGQPLVETVNYISDTECSMVVDQARMRQGAVGVVVYDHQENKISRCRFADGTPSFRGWFANSLKQDLRQESKPVMLPETALYGLCDGDGAKAFWPAHTRGGFPHTVQAHAGLFEIGNDGAVAYHTSGEAGQFPGPVYPEHLVTDTLTHRRFGGSTWFRRNGMVCPADEVLYERPSSGGNAGEYTLFHADDSSRADYVTPMQRCGKSTNVVGVARVEATRFTAGKLNSVVFHRLGDEQLWLPVDELAATVSASHSEVANSERIYVHEVTPTSQDTWTAYVGNSRAVVYRADITADGNSRLYEVSRSKDRDAAAETATGDDGDDGGATFDELAELDDDELLRLRDALNVELDSRLRERR